MSAAAENATQHPNLLSVLRNRNFALLWSGQAISQIGDGLFAMAQIWLVLQLTGSALAMGTTLVFTMLPRLVFQLIGGVSVDRYDRRVLMFFSDAVRSIVVLIFGILVATNQIQMLHVYVLAILFGIVGAFFQPAESALIPNIVPPDALLAANSLTNLTRQLSQIFGPVLAGALITVPFIGIAGVSFINAASFAIGAVGVWLVRLPKHLNGARPANGSFWQNLGDGFRYLLGLRTLVIILLLAMVLNFAVSPIEVVLPIFVKNVLGQGPEGLGLIMASIGVGMLLGSVLIGVWSPQSRRGILSFAFCAAAGILFAAVGLVTVFPVVLILLLVMGMLIAMINTMLNSVMQAMIADEYRGRVLSFDMMLSMGLTPIALGLSGALADTIGPGMVMAAGGALVVVASLGGLIFREIRTLQ